MKNIHKLYLKTSPHDEKSSNKKFYYHHCSLKLFILISSIGTILETIFLSRQVLFELKTNELKIQAKLFETVSLLLKPVDFQLL